MDFIDEDKIKKFLKTTTDGREFCCGLIKLALKCKNIDEDEVKVKEKFLRTLVYTILRAYEYNKLYEWLIINLYH